MNSLRECYDTLSPADAGTLKEAFKREFDCSDNTFYRVLKNSNPVLVHLKFMYKEAGFVYDFGKKRYSIEPQKLREEKAKKYGLTLNA
jgi:hypothetical protein